MDKETLQHIEELYKRNHEASADITALKMLIVCLLEQIPHNKDELSDALTLHYDALNSAMERDGVSELVQRFQRERMDALTQLVTR